MIGRMAGTVGLAYAAARAFGLGQNLADPSHPHRRWIRRVAHVAAGRPLIYKVSYWNGAIVDPRHLRIEHCSFTGSTVLPAIEIVSPGAKSTSQTRLLQRMARRTLLEQQRVRTARKPVLP